jgi:hypothetical protein
MMVEIPTDVLEALDEWLARTAYDEMQDYVAVDDGEDNLWADHLWWYTRPVLAWRAAMLGTADSRFRRLLEEAAQMEMHAPEI